MIMMKGVLFTCMMAFVQGVRVGDVEQTNSTGMQPGMQFPYFALYGYDSKQVLCFWQVESGFVSTQAMREKTWNQWKPILLRGLKHSLPSPSGRPVHKKGKPCGTGKRKGLVVMEEGVDVSIAGEDVCASCCGPACEANAARVLQDPDYRNGFFSWGDMIRLPEARQQAINGAVPAMTKVLNTYPKMDNRAEIIRPLEPKMLQKMPGTFKIESDESESGKWLSEDEAVDKTVLQPPMKFGEISIFMFGVMGL